VSRAARFFLRLHQGKVPHLFGVVYNYFSNFEQGRANLELKTTLWRGYRELGLDVDALESIVRGAARMSGQRNG
jgi:hypothetical protein